VDETVKPDYYTIIFNFVTYYLLWGLHFSFYSLPSTDPRLSRAEASHQLNPAVRYKRNLRVDAVDEVAERGVGRRCSGIACNSSQNVAEHIAMSAARGSQQCRRRRRRRCRRR